MSTRSRQRGVERSDDRPDDDGFDDRDRFPKRRRGFLTRLVRRLVVLGFVTGLLLVAALALYVRYAPSPPDRFPMQTAELFDVNGERVASLSPGQNRQVVALEALSKWVVPAVLAAEDRRFYEHRGVDPLGIGRALAQDLRHKGRRMQGGSTITQQYVKNVYVGFDATVLRKVKEAAIAIKLERKLSKDEILERYLNTIYFGRGCYGIEAASKAYFGKSSSDLRLAEAAYLASVIRSPENTDATKDFETARRRRKSVLDAMRDTGSISDEQREAALDVPLIGRGGVLPRRAAAPAVRQPEAGTQWFVDAVRRELVQRYGAQIVETQGLRVTTTLDLATQRAAYRAAYTTALPDPSDPSAAVVVLDHQGRVKALVGGRDWSASKVNLALGRDGGGAGRPAGSTFKPFVLAAVLRAGYSLESTFPGPARLAIPAGDEGGVDWNVRNFRDLDFGEVTLAEATSRSINTVFAQAVTAKGIGAERVAEAARLLGVSSPLHEYASLALGTAEVSPLEMATSYLTLANRGIRTAPTFLAKVETADGRTLDLVGAERKRVLREADADRINAVLREVVRTGSGQGAAVAGQRIAGKTGTTNDSRDAWFIGYSPERCCVTAVWMGYPEGARAMGTLRGVEVSGATYPAQIFASTMRVAVPRSVGRARFAVVDDFGGEVLPGAGRAPVVLSGGATPSAAPTVPESTGPESTGPESTGPTGDPGVVGGVVGGVDAVDTAGATEPEPSESRQPDEPSPTAPTVPAGAQPITGVGPPP